MWFPFLACTKNLREAACIEFVSSHTLITKKTNVHKLKREINMHIHRSSRQLKLFSVLHEGTKLGNSKQKHMPRM